MKSRRLLNVEVDDEFDDFLLNFAYGEKRRLINNFLTNILSLSKRFDPDFVRCALVNGQYQIVLLTEQIV